MPDHTDVGKRLKKLREENGLTQEELARAVGVERSAIAMYETGRRIPKDGTKVLLAKVFKQPVEKIFFSA